MTPGKVTQPAGKSTKFLFGKYCQNWVDFPADYVGLSGVYPQSVVIVLLFVYCIPI